MTKLTPTTKKLMGIKGASDPLSAYDMAWHNEINDEKIQDGLDDLLDDIPPLLEGAMEAMQAIIGTIMRNPTYNGKARDGISPAVEELNKIKQRFHVAVTDMMTSAFIARKNRPE